MDNVDGSLCGVTAIELGVVGAECCISTGLCIPEPPMPKLGWGTESGGGGAFRLLDDGLLRRVGAERGPLGGSACAGAGACAATCGPVTTAVA